MSKHRHRSHSSDGRVIQRFDPRLSAMMMAYDANLERQEMLAKRGLGWEPKAGLA